LLEVALATDFGVLVRCNPYSCSFEGEESSGVEGVVRKEPIGLCSSDTNWMDRNSQPDFTGETKNSLLETNKFYEENSVTSTIKSLSNPKLSFPQEYESKTDLIVDSIDRCIPPGPAMCFSITAFAKCS
jgi:hypothetical protein